MLICLLAPAPAMLADDPFCVHMIRHTILLLVAAPLIAMAIPAKNSLQKALVGLSRLTFRLTFPAWMIGVGLMWVWHIPALYNAMSMPGMGHSLMPMPMLDRMSLIHAFSMLAGGFLFCWPVITPYAEYRLPPLKAVLYLSGACVFCSLLGLLITFAPAGTYRQVTPADQQDGGLIMWVPCCFIYLSASMYLLIRWFSQKEEFPIIQPLKN
jgi:cytochrome c oxidase assembly factor CtaG